jgi:hypothetical protein
MMEDHSYFFGRVDYRNKEPPKTVLGSIPDEDGF